MGGFLMKRKFTFTLLVFTLIIGTISPIIVFADDEEIISPTKIDMTTNFSYKIN